MKTLDANLVAYAEQDSLLESKIQKDELELNESKKIAGGDLGKIKKCERKVETLADQLPEGAKKIGAEEAFEGNYVHVLPRRAKTWSCRQYVEATVGERRNDVRRSFDRR